MDVESFVREVCQNLPEYSLSLDCLRYKYKECEYSFCDNEDGKIHKVDLPKLLVGYAKLHELWKNKEVFFEGVKTEEDWQDPGQWDAVIVDALIQCSIYGEIIY